MDELLELKKLYAEKLDQLVRERDLYSQYWLDVLEGMTTNFKAVKEYQNKLASLQLKIEDFEEDCDC